MHRAAVSLPIAILLLLSFGTAAPTVASAATPSYDWSNVYVPGQPLRDGMWVPDRLIVHFDGASVPTVSRAKGPNPVTGVPALDAVASRFDVHAMQRLFPEVPARMKAAQPAERARLFTIDFDATRHRLADVAAAYASTPGVVSVEPVGLHYVTANLPDDPGLSSQWWLRNTANGGASIRALAAWYYSTGSSSVIVCDADTGLDWQHPDLGGPGPNYASGVVWTNAAELGGIPGYDDDFNGKVDDFRGWDFVNLSSTSGTQQTPPQDVLTPDNDPMDYAGHGTWVAGCISAISNNSIGITSTNWSAKVMACKIGWKPDTSPGVVRMDFAAQAMDYARLNGASIYNASWNSSDSGGLGVATTLAINAGMIIVTSAGNDNNEVASYLASRSDVISVAATTPSDSKASFSSYGPWVDISAPGETIYTTQYDVGASPGSEHTYGSPSGTSFSSPIVAGAFAMAKAVNPGMSRSQLIDTVLAAVDDLDTINPTYAGKLGSGRLNLAKLFDFPVWEVPEQLPTLRDATNTAAVGDTIAVLGGATLAARVNLPSKGVSILGGYDATYTSRDPVANPTIVDPGGGSGSTVTASASVDSSLVFDGFVIRGGKAPYHSLAPVDGYYGGGILINGGSPTLRNLLVENCIAGLSTDFGAGGAVAVLGGQPTFEHCEFTNNQAMSGAAIYVYAGGPTFVDCNIHDNPSYPSVPSGISAGGAVYVLDSPGGGTPKKVLQPVTFDGGTISGHHSESGGGAIYASNSDLVVQSMNLLNNSTDGGGGALYVDGGSYTGTGNLVRGNSSGTSGLTSGGGLYTTGAAVALTASRYDTNVVTFAGGGVDIKDAPSLSIDQCFVVDNQAGIFGTGVILESPPVGATFTSNTVAQNTGGSAGGNGLYLTGTGSVDIANSIFAFNGGGGTSLADGVQCSGPTATFTCNDAYGNTAAAYGGCPDPTGTNGNLAVDPGFCDLVNSDYRIADTSPVAAAQTGCGTMGADAETCGATAVDPPTPLPRHLTLEQNVPNPFNPRTEIRFDLPRASHVRLRVFDLRGRLVRVLLDGDLPGGRHVETWNGIDAEGRSVASGTYFYELLADGQRRVRKMGLLK